MLNLGYIKRKRGSGICVDGLKFCAYKLLQNQIAIGKVNPDSIMTVAKAFAKSAKAVLRDRDNKEAGANPALFPQLYLVSQQKSHWTFLGRLLHDGEDP